VNQSPRLLRLNLGVPGSVAGAPKIAHVARTTLAIFRTPRLAGHAQAQPRDGRGLIHGF